LGDTNNPLAKRYYDLGGKLFEQNNFDDAIDSYTKALELDPTYSSAYFNRSLCYAIKGNYELASRDALMVMKLEPNSFDAPYVMGIISENKQDFETALKWYDESINKNPSYSPAIERRRNLLERMRRSREDRRMNPPERKTESLLEGPLKRTVGSTRIVEGQIKEHSFYKPDKTLKDVIGLTDVKAFLERRVILPLLRPEGLQRWHIRFRGSILLYGPSGCGKTLLVEALAGEIGAFVLSFELEEVLDMYNGNTEKNIHSLFQQARDFVAEDRSRRVIIFIDELDALGMTRGIDVDSPSRRSAINKLLVELDGIQRNAEGILVVGTTNRPWDIDPALTRAGRFEDELYVPIPTESERRELFAYYLEGVPVADIDFERLARETRGYSPADIELVVSNAKYLANEREAKTGEKTKITTDDLLAELARTKCSLYDWFYETAKELASKPVNKARYSFMFKDMTTVLGDVPITDETPKTKVSAIPDEGSRIPAYT